MQSVILSFVQSPQTINTHNIINPQNDSFSISSTDLSSSTSASHSDLNGQCVNKKDIYVCTFCQVFSPNLTTVANHISTVHSESLLVGTKPENFVSKLQPLEGNSHKKRGKVGRPRKQQEKSISPVNAKQKVVDPVPDSNGLFWCKVCLRHFRKSRQLIQHICLDPEGEISSDESSIELDEDVEFRTHMNVDKVPWSRCKKVRNSKENSTYSVNSEIQMNERLVSEAEEEILKNKVIPNWRNDPTYVPLFDDAKEKAAFEEHLRSIDYSYVDNLYEIEEKRCRNKSKNNCLYVQSVVYSCNFCKKDFKSLSLIRLHCLTHTDFKPFTCPKCSYRTNATGSLYMHMRIHTGNVFRCSFCDFTCIKRSHLLDHEATHSTVYQTCKLCKNSYKTLRSLVAHVRKYHNYTGGRKYLKLLTCKQCKEFKCDICHKKFKSVKILNNHNHACHETAPVPDKTLVEEDLSKQNSEETNQGMEDIQVNSTSNMDLSATDLQYNGIQATKDPLAEIMLNNFLQQQQQSDAIMYEDVFNNANGSIISPTNSNLLCDFQPKIILERLAESAILEECQKTLGLDMLKECLQDSSFSNECQEFNLMPSITRRHSLQNNTTENDADVTSDLTRISEDKLEGEPKSAEITLFEKCQRAPAYVCCVCSSIFICPATLKAHLKEHVNSTNSSFMDEAEEQFEPTKITETSDELDVCQILQDSSESCSYAEELEKLYTSSLDMMYYLPEVSVVLQNDPALFDPMLDDISNFPISDNSSQDLNMKDLEEESVLKCFSGV